jgi:hypothetical protein
MQLAVYVGMVHRAEQTLADSLRQVADGHGDEPDVRAICRTLAEWSDRHVEAVRPIADRYGEQEVQEPERLHAEGLAAVRSGPVGLLRDLQDLSLLATLVSSTWTVLGQAAQGARDHELLAVVQSCESETQRQLQWFDTRLKQAAPQALLVAT